jgi:hypothetical protein
MLVSLADYGKIHGRSGDTLRRMAENGAFATARKIGRNWVVDSNEDYPIKKRNAPVQLSLFDGVESQQDTSQPMAINTSTAKTGRYSCLSVEKTNGVVYTPSELADYVAREMLLKYKENQTKKAFSILDPSVGDGELVLALIQRIRDVFDDAEISVFGYETDSSAIKQTMLRINERYPSAKITIENQDFLDAVNTGINQKYDFIIANPPYIRTQILGAEKAQDIAAFTGLNGRVDIYYAFLIVAERLLCSDGVAGFITSNKFMTIKAGQAVRQHLVNKTDILQVTDFGDTKLFSASVLPCVIVFRKKQTPVDASYTSIYESRNGQPECVLDSIFEGIDTSRIIGLCDGRKFDITSGTLQANLDGSPWRVSTISRNSWLERVDRNTARRFCDLGKIRVGIKTTADNVFIKDTWEHEEYVPELLRPLITHRNAGQISTDIDSYWQVLYTHTVINGKKTAYDIERYPNSFQYLSAHREQLEGRSYVIKAKRNWYEIWVPQNPTAWGDRKIVFRDIADVPQFWLDETGAVVNGDCYWMEFSDDTSDDEVFLALAVANSKFIEQYYDMCFNNKLYSGKRRFMSQYVEQFPLPDCSSENAQATICAVKEIIYASPSRQQKEMMLQEINALVDSLFVN